MAKTIITIAFIDMLKEDGCKFGPCLPPIEIKEVKDDVSELFFEESDNWTCVFSLIAAQTKEIKELKAMIKEMGGK